MQEDRANRRVKQPGQVDGRRHEFPFWTRPREVWDDAGLMRFLPPGDVRAGLYRHTLKTPFANGGRQRGKDPQRTTVRDGRRAVNTPARVGRHLDGLDDAAARWEYHGIAPPAIFLAPHTKRRLSG